MTPRKKNDPEQPCFERQYNLLEKVLTTVQSIDRNVEDLLDRLEDHIKDRDYHPEPYREPPYGFDLFDDYDE